MRSFNRLLPSSHPSERSPLTRRRLVQVLGAALALGAASPQQAEAANCKLFRGPTRMLCDMCPDTFDASQGQFGRCLPSTPNQSNIHTTSQSSNKIKSQPAKQPNPCTDKWALMKEATNCGEANAALRTLLEAECLVTRNQVIDYLKACPSSHPKSLWNDSRQGVPKGGGQKTLDKK